MDLSPQEILELLPFMTPEERAEFDSLLTVGMPVWSPLKGPQMMAYESKADIIGYGGAAGGGKGQALDAPILTPFGFRPMGSLKVGSQVCNPDGSIAAVIGVYPLGLRQLYRFKFHDGTSCEVTDDHIWLAWKASRGSKVSGVRSSGEDGAKLWTTLQLIEAMKRGARPIMPIADAVTFTDSARYPRRPVDPYLLGVLLGDGSITEKALRISCAEPETIERIESRTGYRLLGPYKYEGRVAEYRLREPNDLRPHLTKWGLIGCGSARKFIPEPYLLGSVEERWELLRGLMDTDGWADADGDTYYCTISERLRDDVATLARSLGAMVTIRTKEARAQNGNGSTAFTLRIKLRQPERAFALERKRDVCSGKSIQSMGRKLVSIEPTRMAHAQCIKVNHPNSLYITDDFIVTHNTDLAIGLALTKHTSIIMLRRESTQLNGITERLEGMLGNAIGYNSQRGIWKIPGSNRRIVFGSTPHLGDERKYQGRPNDLWVFDEATNFLEHQVRFLMGWNRTHLANQPCRVLLTFNPPTSAEGQWVIAFFAPWLVKEHPNPALPGELRWFGVVNGKDYEVADGREFVLVKDVPTYDFDRKAFLPTEIIKPKSRTFIPSRITDNPYLMGTGYMSTLQSMPEPLRSQMLNGDFEAGTEDDPYQIIPSSWVKAAQERWEAKHAKGTMDSIGSDPARGGQDEHVISRRHGTWFDELITYPGTESPDGPTVATQILAVRRDNAPVHIDIVGWGSSPYDFLNTNGVQVIGVNNATKSVGTAKEGQLGFRNLRAELWWRMREALDPMNPDPIFLPPDPQLRADLCAPKWLLSAQGIQVETKDEIKKRIGRSPDRGDAVVMAAIMTMRTSSMISNSRAAHRRPEYNPWATE